MIPLRDNIPPRTPAVVNYLMIAICGLVFFLQLGDQKDGQDELVEKYGMIPARVMHPDQPVVIREQVLKQLRSGDVFAEEQEREIAAPSFSPWLTLLTCTFLHGGWMHVIGNLWFLHIFGDNVEDRFGHGKYLLFYLACGIMASATHLLTNLGSNIPTIGASGAIAGVMGAYFVLYPHAKVLTLIPLGVFSQAFLVPAPVFLGIWFVIQFVQGTLTAGGTEAEGVAWWAHIGGYAFGMALAWVLSKTGVLRAPVDTVYNAPNQMRYFRHR